MQFCCTTLGFLDPLSEGPQPSLFIPENTNKTHPAMGPIQNWDLKASQLVTAGFVGLMAGQDQRPVFARVTFKYSKVQETLISLNLDGAIPCNTPWPLNVTALKILLIFPLFQLGLHLAGDRLGPCSGGRTSPRGLADEEQEGLTRRRSKRRRIQNTF